MEIKPSTPSPISGRDTPNRQPMLRDLLQRTFGFSDFRPGQEAVLSSLMAGHSAAAVFPTGGGKSICYQLPALALDGLTLVVSPLIALMKDQIDALTRRGVAAARLDSTLSADEVADTMSRARSGKLKLLYVAPERFNNERFREALEGFRIALFAVDEAHCISEWGHNFRPDYLKLAGFARRYKAERILALTATAAPAVLTDICRGFSIDPKHAVRTGFHRPNLTVLTTPIAAAHRDAVLIERFRSQPPGPAIVYVTLQRTAERTAERLAAAGFDARAYHAGMEDAERSAVQEWFLKSDDGIVVATIAFGMGIDKPNIRYVYHYNQPKSLENLSQEIGRAGRDGLPARCELFFFPDDLNALENFAHGDTPSAESVADFVGEIFSQGPEIDVSLYDLAGRHDIKQLVVRTLLVYLELDGYLEEGTPYYARYQFKPLASSAGILSRFDGERREFLAKLFRAAKPSKIWFSLDLAEACQATGAGRDRIVRALDYLSEQQLLELKTEGVRNRFKRLRAPADLRSLGVGLHAKLLDRERRELARLRQVLDLAALDGCQTSALGEHFGEPRAEPCGHCSWCLNGRRPARLLPRTNPPIAPDIWRQTAAIQRKHPEMFGDPRRMARFLCGLTSPAVSKLRLGGDPLFGALADCPFAEVLQELERR